MSATSTTTSTLTPPSAVVGPMPLMEQCVAMCQECLAHLDEDGAIENEEAVHDLRVATKRLRAAWNLAKAADPELAKQRNAALRDLSAAVAGHRDQAVLVALARELSLADDGDSLFADLADELEAAEPVDDPADHPTEPALIAGWTRELHAWQQLEAELGDESARRRLYRNALRRNERGAQRATRAALSDDEAELWHDWRKAVKRLRYQREFVARRQGRQPGLRDARISRLGTRLGERNDLANLALAADAFAGDDGARRQRLRKVLAQRERRIMSNARRLGRLLFLR